MLYGGDRSTLVNRLGISEEVAKPAIESFGSDSPASRSGGSEWPTPSAP